MRTAVVPASATATFLVLLGCSSSPAGAPNDGGSPETDGAAGSPDASDSGATSEILDEAAISQVDGSLREHEPSIAVSPHGRVAVSFLSTVGARNEEYTVGYRISNDDGATWGPATLFPMPADDNIQANASVAADAQDNLYMAWAAESKTAQGARSGLHVFVAKSAPGETTFGRPIEVTDPSKNVLVYDLPRIAVTAAGVVNVTYAEFSADGQTTTLMDARSTDLQTWTRTPVAGPSSPGSYQNFGRICQGPNGGRIYYAYVDSATIYYASDLGAVTLRSSDDDGATWSSPVVVSTKEEEGVLADWSTDCVTNGDDVWVLYTIAPNAWSAGEVGTSPNSVCTLTGLRLAHSGDRGRTIDARLDVADTSAGSLSMYPVLAVEPSGVLDIAYYVGSADNDPAAALRRSRSTDGKTFPQSVLVHQPLTLETSRVSPKWIGDYVGRAYSAGKLYLVYQDNATNTPHINFYRTPVGLPPSPPLADAGAPDTGSDAAPIDAGPPGCNAYTRYTSPKWAPPTSFGQHACSGAQVQAYVTCANASDCAAFRQDAANAACLACVETDVGAAAFGPMIMEKADGGVSARANYGGCQAHFDGDVGPDGCGAQRNDSDGCTSNDCAGCSDSSNPAPYGPTYNCYYESVGPGTCAAHRYEQRCYLETVDAGASVCDDLKGMLSAWCG